MPSLVASIAGYFNRFAVFYGFAEELLFYHRSLCVLFS